MAMFETMGSLPLISVAAVVATLHDVRRWIGGKDSTMATMRPRNSLLTSKVKSYYEVSLNLLVHLNRSAKK